MKYNLKFDDISLNCKVSDKDVLNFAKAYFTPFFTISRGYQEDSIVEIEVVIHPTLIGEYPDKEHILIDGSKGFLSTTGIVLNDGVTREVVLMPTKTLVNIDKASKRISIIGSSPDNVKIPLLRVIEDLTQIEVERRGGVFIHASGIVIDDSVVLSVGDKGAGKTSFLCNSLASFHCQKLTNDNAVLYLKNEVVMVMGWPSFFKIELGTIAHSELLANFFPDEEIALLDTPTRLWDKKIDKVPLYPREGALKLRSDILSKGQLHTIVFPMFSLEDIGCEPTNLDAKTFFERLQSNLQGSFNSKHSNWHNYNEVSRDAITSSLENISNVMSKQCESYKINWGPSFSQLITEVNLMKTVSKSFTKAKANKSDPQERWPGIPAIKSL